MHPYLRTTKERTSTIGGLFAHADHTVIHGGNFTDASTSHIHNITYNTNHFKFNSATGMSLLSQNMAPGAMHNSKERFNPPRCEDGTRVQVKHEAMQWIQDPLTLAKVLALLAPAGAGKSAIAQSLAEYCSSQNILAASFFFSRNDKLRNNDTRLIATITYQVALINAAVKPFICEAVERDPSIFQKDLETQTEVLLATPFRLAMDGSGPGRNFDPKWPSLVLLEALDECKGEEKQRAVLQAFRRKIVDANIPLRILVTSRPEFAARSGFEASGPLCGVTTLINLDAKYKPSRDIWLYLQRQFRHIATNSNDPRITPSTWPPPSDIETLVERANGQFIYGSTAIKFVSERHSSAFDRLKIIIRGTAGTIGTENPFASLDDLYVEILTNAQSARPRTGLADNRLELVRLIQKLAFFEDYPIDTLEDLFMMRPGTIEQMLSDLHSLVGIERVPGYSKVKFHHLSLLDWLEDPVRAKDLYVPQDVVCAELAVSALERIKGASQEGE
ncbi:hypothetical protein CC2G_004757 [Coprinopsis cinerea AmutBmut pab1-1]|nr:hypothetical protein CC2G_004757 [Coprinopsis cinerea AmutBmut pab1-1]